jgi:ankyrin repeat protein/GNAT superfamily N-acetyltransferase
MERRIDLDRARREAKRRAKASGVKLADAQRAVARELGEASWPRLVRRVEAEAVAREDRARQLVVEATNERRDHAEALLALDPELGREGLDAALVLGEVERVRAALARDQGLVSRPTGARDWLPLLYPCHSAFLGGERTDGLVECARLLLEAGADPDSSWQHPEFGSLGALYGAAGVAHEPRMTALLLEAGADPNDGESVYHATETGDDTCLRLLLAAGARVEGTNALAHCLDTEKPAMLRLLLDHDPGREVERSLLWAIYRGRSTEVLRMLVEAGADLEARDPQNERTPYGLAWRMGRPDVCEWLAGLGARRELGPVDELIGLAFAGDRDGALRLAAQDPARAERVRTEFAEALHQAAAEGRRDAVEILLDLGLPSDRPGQMQGTPLHHAAWWGHGDVVALLLARGSSPAWQAEGDATPLAWTAHGSFHSPGPVAGGGTDHLRIAQRLVQAGAVIEPEMIHEAAPELAEWLEVQAAEPAIPNYAELEHAAHAAYLAALPGQRLELGDGFAVRTGLDSNSENGVVADDADVAAVTVWLGDAPAQWLISAGSGLGERLVAAGWRPERTAVVMGARLADLRLGAPEGEPAGAEEHAEVLRAAGWDVAAAGAQARVVAGRGGRAVGGVSVFTHADTTVVLELVVLPEHRRQGIGRALMARALQGAAEYVVLGPTPESIAFYRALGFELVPALRDRCYYGTGGR